MTRAEKIRDKLRREKLRWSKIYTFNCARANPELIDFANPFNGLQGPGFSRKVQCNQPSLHRRKPLHYPSNYISTTKYNIITFLPKAIFEQFRRVANLYFLLAAVLSLTPIAPFSAVSMIAPLAFVVGLSMAKEAVEDWRRFMQDMKVNKRKVSIHKGDGNFYYKKWHKIFVGDVVKVEKDHFFPADLLLLSSSYEDGICYVETMNLDGETNLKVKRALDVTLHFDEDKTFKDFYATIRCEDPNPSLYTFVGNLEYEKQVCSLDPNQILLRDSKLRNTSYIYGVVIFTGHDSKVMQNSTESPSKRSSIEKKMDYIIYILFTLLVLISLISSIGYAVYTKFGMRNWWYLQPENASTLYNPLMPALSGIFHLVTALIMYGYLIPVSLYVSIEVVKVLQAMFINQDIQMYDEDTGKPAEARTSNLNEELGQVDTILSDKTGTLTCNQMDFLKCSIAGVSYGVGSSEVEIAAAKHIASEFSGSPGHNCFPADYWDNNVDDSSVIQLEDGITCKVVKDPKPKIKGFSFEDDRLMQGNWVKEPSRGTLQMFFRVLAVCHTAIPEHDEENGTFTYEAESPDEGAFLVAAREFGFEFFKRTQSSVFIRESYPNPLEREFKILNLLEFNSKRKRMSVIVRDDSGQIILFCKGADSIIFDRLSKNGKMYEADTMKHLNEFGEAGLRTLALAYKVLDESEYSTWNAEFLRAKTAIGLDRDAQLEQVADLMERELVLIGATAVEDKLQKGVPQCIDKLAQAGLKIWLLTGDKMETAVNIGLLRLGLKQISISTMNTDFLDQDAKKAFLSCLEQNIKDNILLQITNASRMVKLEKDPHAAFALIIDGKALSYALEDDMKHHFLGLAVDCASVICCRVSPKQKALVTRLVKEGTGKTTLAIGDGANDVGMIQEADIGVGISGVEGMQFPALYQQGPKNLFFDWSRIIAWTANGLYSSIVVFFINISIFYDQAFQSEGQTADMAAMGTTMFTCIIWAVNLQIALTMSHFTWIQHLFVWGSVSTWYLFLFGYGFMSPVISGNAFHILIESLGPAPIYWITTFLVAAACNLPYFAHLSYQRLFYPLDHHVIQEIKYFKKDLTDEQMWTRERSKARQETKIGFTARVDAKIRQLKGKLQKKTSNLFNPPKHEINLPPPCIYSTANLAFSRQNFIASPNLHQVETPLPLHLEMKVKN
ncbi:Putative phospholipid-transporting ATPase 4 [Dendrobium catenatum]|uniref:Phospholipid-transporting ATPase n=1 Tax=Dendrobium catenatum TaxID=906689 RepID=A0A2I0X5Z2_9ASPA|nr:Putative phospholipid-transporting ATPase 4 [Dendrobium catenatum]